MSNTAANGMVRLLGRQPREDPDSTLSRRAEGVGEGVGGGWHPRPRGGRAPFPVDPLNNKPQKPWSPALMCGLEDLLLAMRRRRLQLAVVQDATDGTLGIVTLEHVVEELVGDIQNESDPHPVA